MLAVAVLLVALVVPNVVARPSCGFEEGANTFLQGQRARREVSTVDSRFKQPGTDTVLSGPACSMVLGGLGAYGYSQCLIEDVINSYKTTSNWPSAALSLKVITYRSSASASSGWITSAQVDTGMAITNAAYAASGISFSYTFESQMNATAYNYYNTTKAGIDNLDSMFDWVRADFGIGATTLTRQHAVYLLIVPTDYSSFAGLCFPVPGFLNEVSTLPASIGGICIVDPAFILSFPESSSAFPLSKGFTAAHEFGHALGLLHPHQSVSQKNYQSGVFTSCSTPSVSSSCVASGNDYGTGDYIKETPPVPNPLSYSASMFDFSTCQITSTFPNPRVCNGVTNQDIRVSTASYMSYYPENCTNSFSPSQIARMRCVVDRYLDYGGTTVSARAYPPVSLVAAKWINSAAISVTWVPPLNLLAYTTDSRPTSLPSPANLSYVITRSPAFSAAVEVSSSTYSYVDTTVIEGPKYTYAVVARYNGVLGGQSAAVEASSVSPLLVTALLGAVLTLFAVVI